MKAAIPEVTSCCWYFSLRTGTKVFGFISVLGSLTLALLSAVEIIWEKQSSHAEYEELDGSFVLFVDIIFQVVHLITSVLLVLAAYQENPKFIPPWLVSTIIVAILELFFLPAFLFRFFGYGIHSYGNESILLQLLMLLDDLYAWFVVYSYHRTLQQGL